MEISIAVQRIADYIGDYEDGGNAGRPDPIQPKNVGGILGIGNGDANCYPGIPGAGCKRIAYFVSLTDRRYVVGRGHLKFRDAMDCLIQHMQGHCAGYTCHACFIADTWDQGVANLWRANIEKIRKDGAVVDAYLVANGKVVQMPL